MAARYDFTADQGATFDPSFTWTAPDGSGVQQPVDLTGCTARMVIRSSYTAPTTLDTLTTENGGITLGAGGLVSLLRTATQTAAWALTAAVGYPPKQNFIYDLEVIFASGVVRRLMNGLFVVIEQVP